jgi:hypothetical protein
MSTKAYSLKNDTAQSITFQGSGCYKCTYNSLLLPFYKNNSCQDNESRPFVQLFPPIFYLYFIEFPLSSQNGRFSLS